VANGVIAVPIMAMLVLVASNARAMGQFAARGTLRAVAWVATAVMAAAVVLLVWSMLR
jgi:Mn2+/Fe2+ NRAMP family transporter